MRREIGQANERDLVSLFLNRPIPPIFWRRPITLYWRSLPIAQYRISSKLIGINISLWRCLFTFQVPSDTFRRLGLFLSYVKNHWYILFLKYDLFPFSSLRRRNLIFNSLKSAADCDISMMNDCADRKVRFFLILNSVYKIAHAY